jgi:superfamily I DNA/RNA helicase
MFIVTPAHKLIFDTVKDRQHNAQISAVAGSGKTSTILEALKYCDPSESIMFLAFNKKIAVEIEGRVKALGINNVTVKTLNALGHGAYCATRGGFSVVKLDTDKVRGIADRLVTESALASDDPNDEPVDHKTVRFTVCQLVRLAKSAGMIPSGVPGGITGIIEDTVDAWTHLIEHHDIPIPDGVNVVVLIDLARDVLRESLKMLDVIDFDDQLLHTHAYQAPVRRFDRVFVDESQDLSPLQHELVAKAIKPDGRIVSVGDDAQAIYGFRGADADSMAKLAERFDMQKLPLHVSYRCPKAVVAVAQTYVPHILPHESATEGYVDEGHMDYRHRLNSMKGGDMVVCRFNAPLAAIAYGLLKARIPCVIMGRDIGSSLKSLVKKMKTRTISTLISRLEDWEKAEVSRLKMLKKDAQAAAASDKVDTIRIFCEDAATVNAVETAIDRMFSDTSSGNVVTLCSIHKSKGLEAHRVFAVNFGQVPKFATKPWMIEQEKNLLYVACTRAKHSLIMIDVPRP